MKVSIIIPTYNEANNIPGLIKYLQSIDHTGQLQEIIVVDGGSTDNTLNLVRSYKVLVVSMDKQNRAQQMNVGAANASGEILYFLHADTFPPDTLFSDLSIAIEKGYKSGCYQLSFDKNHWFLQLNCWFTRFNINAFRFGDQSLYITKKLFREINGFNNKMVLLEDNDIVRRIRKRNKFIVFGKKVITMSRKYTKYGCFRLQFLYYLIYFLYQMGASQTFLVKQYEKFTNDN